MTDEPRDDDGDENPVKASIEGAEPIPDSALELPDPQNEARNSAAAAGKQQDGKANRRARKSGGVDPSFTPSDAVLARCAEQLENDIGNGQRFLLNYGGDVIYVTKIGWFIYDGRRYHEDDEGAHIRPLAHFCALRIAEESRFVEATNMEAEAIRKGDEAYDEWYAIKKTHHAKRTKEQDDRYRELTEIIEDAATAAGAIKDRRARRVRFGKGAGNSGKLDNMLKEAAPYVSEPVENFDKDPLAFNCLSGTLRLIPRQDENGEFYELEEFPHEMADLITKLMPVEYDAEAECPNFLSFLEQVQPDPEIRAFLQRYLGYCLTGLSHEQVFCFFWGGGRNGKSTLVDLICRILDDYAATVPFETLAGDDRRKGSEATPELARLFGKRLVRSSEPEQKMVFRESLVKSLTSGEEILVRRLHHEFVPLRPEFKLVVSGNHKPRIEGADDGIWRRVILVPWPVQIAKDQVDKKLPDKLWRERSGILNWLLAGAISYLEDGLMIPEKVREATEEYREESDPVGAFIKGACEVTGDDLDTCIPGEIFDAYARFAKEQGLYEFNKATFSKRFRPAAEANGARRAKSHGTIIYRGLRIKSDYLPPMPQPSDFPE